MALILLLCIQTMIQIPTLVTCNYIDGYLGAYIDNRQRLQAQSDNGNVISYQTGPVLKLYCQIHCVVSNRASSEVILPNKLCGVLFTPLFALLHIFYSSLVSVGSMVLPVDIVLQFSLQFVICWVRYLLQQSCHFIILKALFYFMGQ